MKSKYLVKLYEDLEILILICLFFVFFRRRGPCGCSLRNGDADVTNRELLEEVRRLRQEVEALKSDKNQ